MLIDQRLGTARQSGKGTRLVRRLRRRCILCAGGARCVARTGFRASFDGSRVGHRGGFSRLESGTTTPLPPPPEVAWCPCGFPPRKKKARTTTSEPIKVFEFVFELLRFVCDVVSHLPRVIPRYLTESLLGIVVMLMVKCCNVKGLFSQRECYMGGFFFVNFEAPFMKPLFHRVEISLESG